MSDDIDIGDAQPEPPLFTIITRGSLRLVDPATGAGVRPCDHPRYILDDKWLTVTCAECKERLDAYAVLRTHAAYSQRIEHDRLMTIQAHCELLRTTIRELLRRSCFTDDERLAYKRRTYVYGREQLSALKTLRSEVEKRIDDASDERVRKRLEREQSQPQRAPNDRGIIRLPT